MSRLPKVSTAAIEAALRRFDVKYRATEEWEAWPTRADKNAISHGGRVYPPKFVVHLATGAPLNTFSGGREVNTYLERLGFTLVRLRPEEDQGPRYRATYLIRSVLLGNAGGEPITAFFLEDGWVISDDPATGYDDLDAAIAAWERRGRRSSTEEPPCAAC